MQRTPNTVAFWAGHLPHWEVEDGRYFVTMHLAGAIPVAGRQRLREVSAELGRAEKRGTPNWLNVHRAIFAEMEAWLDRAEWRPLLRRPQLAELVLEAIEHRRATGDWAVHEFVVMPTHLHLFCEVHRGGLTSTLRDFKRWTTQQARKILGGDPQPFWQREWFDHWSRSDEEDDRIIHYIQQNPVKAGLVKTYLDWPYGSWREASER